MERRLIKQTSEPTNQRTNEQVVVSESESLEYLIIFSFDLKSIIASPACFDNNNNNKMKIQTEATMKSYMLKQKVR